MRHRFRWDNFSRNVLGIHAPLRASRACEDLRVPTTPGSLFKTAVREVLPSLITLSNKKSPTRKFFPKWSFCG
jgi:hypothetical protein